MKAMMSEKLRNILNNPDDARQLQKLLQMPRSYKKEEALKQDHHESPSHHLLNK